MVSKAGKASRLITLPGTQRMRQPPPRALRPRNRQQHRLWTLPRRRVRFRQAQLTVLPCQSFRKRQRRLPILHPQLPAAAKALRPRQPCHQAPTALPGATEVQVTAVRSKATESLSLERRPLAQLCAALPTSQRRRAVSDASGNFVIEGEMKLEVGNHIIEVELLDKTGKIVVRASVPFERPAGEQVSVVTQTAPYGAAAASPEQAEFERLRISLTKAMTILENLFANGQKPALEQAAAARSATEIGLRSIASFRAESTAPAEFGMAVQAHATKAKEALALLQSVPAGNVDALGAALPKLVALIRGLLDEPTPAVATEPAPAAETLTVDNAAAAQAQPAASSSAEPKTIQQAPLAQATAA